MALDAEGYLSEVYQKLGYVPKMSGHPSFGGSVPFNKRKEAPGMQPQKKIEKPKSSGTMDKKPPASKHSGKVIVNEKGIRYKSNGKIWVRQ